VQTGGLFSGIWFLLLVLTLYNCLNHPMHNPESSEQNANNQSATPAKENKEKLLPPTTITLILAPHATAEHAQGLREKLQPGVTFVPELAGWNTQSKQVLQDVAAGSMRPVEAINYLSSDTHDMRPYMLQLLHELYQTQVQIVLIDEQKTDETYQTLNAQKLGIDLKHDFEETLQEAVTTIKTFNAAQSQREDLMIARLLDALADVDQPQQLVLSLGSAHQGFAAKLAAQKDTFTELDIEVEQKEVSVFTDFFSEAAAGLESGVESDQELLAKVVLEGIIGRSLIKAKLEEALGTSFAAAKWIRAYVAKFSFDEIRGIYQEAISVLQLQQVEGQVMSIGGGELAGLPMVMEQVLRQHRLVLPEADERNMYWEMD
jgi:hypothetical protein